MKNIIIYVVILLLIIVSILIALGTTKEESDKRLELLEHIDTKISFFNYNYIDRYVSYHLKNKSLPLKNVIIEVNIGLDYDYYQNTKIAPNLYTEKVLVNKYHYLEENYIPKNLTELYEGYSKPGMYLVKEASDAYGQMAQDIRKENLKIRAISSYRSYDYQKRLYEKYEKIDGKQGADKYSARPGFSEHQTGLVVDIDNEVLSYEEFGKTEEFKWMQKNAHKYGFILRYPEGKEFITGYTYEAWHYRYVGKKIASYIKKHNITFDEYCAIKNFK